MTDSFCVITTALDDRQAAENMASNLIEGGLAACVQILPIHSVYRWKGKLESTEEHLLLIKTVERLYPSVESVIREQHPYELPEIVRLPIDGGFAPYLEWIGESVIS